MVENIINKIYSCVDNVYQHYQAQNIDKIKEELGSIKKQLIYLNFIYQSYCYVSDCETYGEAIDDLFSIVHDFERKLDEHNSHVDIEFLYNYPFKSMFYYKNNMVNFADKRR